MKELAAAARLTPNHFTTLFREHTGRPFTEFLTEERIARAKKLLLNPTLSINEVAKLAGYDDPGYFTRFYSELNLGPQGLAALYGLDGVARARKLQRRSPVHVVNAFGDAENLGTVVGSGVLRVVNIEGHVDRDTANLIDEFLEGRKVNPRIEVDRDAEDLLNRLARQFWPAARIIKSVSEELGRVDAPILVTR